MMTRKKRRTVLIIIILLTLIILGATFVLLYLNTDMFKSNQTLFAKYLGKNLNNIKDIEEIVNLSEYDESLKTNPYNESIEARVNYTQNMGTTEENNNNSINSLKITSEGQIDNSNQYDYRNINLLNNDEQVMQVEVLHNSNNYGIRFSDLFNQYIVAENANLKELFRKIGYNDEQLQNIPDSITLNEDVLNQLKFSDEEIESLKEKYIELIGQNLTNTNFQKQSGQLITINGQNYSTNAYILTLTKEQLNNIYINILQNLKEDETILTKIDNLQSKINEITLGNNDLDLRENIINTIDKEIQNINQSNIGNDETRIIVYESEGETIRTSIETQDYQMNFDFLQTESEKFVELSIVEGEKETYNVTLDYNSNDLSVEIQDKSEESTITFERTQEVNNQKRDEKYNLTYILGNQKVVAKITRSTDIIQNIENRQNFNEENAVILNNLEEAQAQQILDTVRNGLNSKLETVREEINYQDVEQMLINMKLLQNSTVLDSTGITETEKNRFNSTFELLQGENLSGENVSRSIQVIKSNLGSIDVVSNNELVINIVRSQGNEELADTLTNFLEDRNKEYNLSVEYDENGLVNQLVLTIVEED